MKDIEKVTNLLTYKGVSKTHFARAIGTTRQNIANWEKNSGIPKKFLLPTVVYLSKLEGRKVSIEELLGESDAE